MKYEMVIGLETHIELSTNSKLFCDCKAKFGEEPNTNVCPVCLGHPGVLPNLNRSAVEYTIQAGLSIGCAIAPLSKMDRKHYFYPDLPKAWQTSQLYAPLCIGGTVELASGRVIRMNHIHLEEDAGKLIHERGRIYIDYNRGGVPLMECVSEPDLRSADEAVEYLEILQGVMRTIGVSDCRMQEGSMRCDVNISLRPEGAEKLGIRAEIKNLNSFTAVRAAIAYEYERQTEILDNGGTVVQETRGFDGKTTASLRDKENSDDYRYFPEPDIITIAVSDADVERLQSQLPELPRVREARYVAALGLSEKDAAQLSKYRRVAEFFENAGASKLAANLILTQMFSRISTEVERELWNVPFSALDLKALIFLIDSGKLARNAAKQVLTAMLDSGEAAETIASREGLLSTGEAIDLAAAVADAIAANPGAAADYKAGKTKAAQAIIGAVMKATKGKANPEELRKTAENALSQ
ncbi:MAG: Asp-tRNA(Asn)/Glu-tRNA(Gln) amidotransferase subunit GatB [Oscillospiraceae bacterium]|jgi:aspartyl-tRNA(Asn)/glutamyl-tRNA(Gln) amidotransferase subunit B|nr:Asp-tRNA(Asn)/Glu-tRNA(Gln) amidotransferase subunit GatB [Oscillospiraceae bacterium]